MIVVDANVVIYLVFETSFTPLAREVYARDPEWVVPEPWEAEVLNGLTNEVRAGHANVEGAIRAAGNAAVLLFGKVRQCDRTMVLRTANTCRLTAYDAYYVVLARTLGVQLVTEDGAIKENCRDVARSLSDYLGLEERPKTVRESRARYQTRKRR